MPIFDYINRLIFTKNDLFTITRSCLLGFVTVLLCMMLTQEALARGGHTCSLTAKFASYACSNEARDDFWIARANCLNLRDTQNYSECKDDAHDEKMEVMEECQDQLDARKELCDKLGEAPYNITEYWMAENFVNPLEIGNSIAPNNYFPLIEGVHSLEGDGETTTITVTQKTKLIAGVTCLVVNDVVKEEGVVHEDTDDWYAQDIFGNVWYCGEISKDFEFVEGDEPSEAELVEIEGSWKAFRDDAMPGIIMQANPQVGNVYRQEVALGDAEDAAQVLDIAADGLAEGDECEEDAEEIAELIDSLCNNDCLLTRDFTPIEPDVYEHKYYAFGVGVILEIDNEGSCAAFVSD